MNKASISVSETSLSETKVPATGVKFWSQAVSVGCC